MILTFEFVFQTVATPYLDSPDCSSSYLSLRANFIVSSQVPELKRVMKL